MHNFEIYRNFCNENALINAPSAEPAHDGNSNIFLFLSVLHENIVDYLAKKAD